ncbi:MAG: tRNA 2-thiocytidine(32) synthetase TtcA, partial [Proteobacteria bacterium]|nr:tRNA 2-thiocytidine(32) synthetase TtcA [Pseudomonadota bacterium]
MLRVLRQLRRRSPVPFELIVVTVHQGAAGFDADRLEAYYKQEGLDYRIVHVPIDQILQEKLAPGATPCSLCSRIRRGVLYNLAPAVGCNKIALG